MSFYTRFGGSRIATDIGVIMGPDKDSVCKKRSNFLIFYIFADIPFFSPGRDELLGRAGQENIGTVSGSKVIKLFFMLNLAEHEVYHAHEC